MVPACGPRMLDSMIRALLVGAILMLGALRPSAAAAQAANFYIFGHFQDYRDEMYFLRQYSPFAFRPAAPT